MSTVATFFIGFAIGFSISLIYQDKLNVIGQYSGLISGIIGGVVSLLKVIIDRLKENVFEYGGIYKREEIRSEYEQGGWIPKELARYHETAYFLRIVKHRGKGRLEECDGRITIDGRLTIPVSWQGQRYEKFRNISTEDSIRLFNISEDGKQVLLLGNPDSIASKMPYTTVSSDLDEETLSKKTLSITWSKEWQSAKKAIRYDHWAAIYL